MQQILALTAILGAIFAVAPAQAAAKFGNATATRKAYLASLDKKAQNVSVHEALLTLRRQPGQITQELASFVESELAEQTPKKLRGGAQKQLLQNHLKVSDDMKHTAKGPSIGKAEAMISDMIQESQLKLDAERERCVAFWHTQTDQLEETRTGIAEQQAKAAAARAEKLRASAEITFIDGKQPVVVQDLKTHNDQCAEDIAGLEGQLAIVNQDLQVMGLILNMTKCSEDGKLFLQTELKCCKHKNHTTLLLSQSSPLSQLKSGVAQFLLGENFPEERLAVTESMALEQQEDAPLGDYFVLYNEPELSGLVSVTSKTSKTAGLVTSTPMPVAAPKVCPHVAGKKCTITDSPACPKINRKFLKIDSGIKAKKKELETDLMMKRKFCKAGTDKMEAEIADLDTLRTSEETNVAKATGEINEAETTLGKMQKRFDKLTGEYVAELEGCTVYEENDDIQYELVEDAGTCANKIHEYEAEICGLKKIRMELAKLQGDDIYMSDVIDCEVSDWIEGDCSQPCGSGIMTKKRTIKVNPNENGAKCPPLEIDEVCNPNPCPVDCKVDEWQEWSACSASCGTGVKERIRSVLKHAAFGGTPCDSTNEDESCNTQSCDQDCILAEWCEWTACDKECGGGSQSRVRHIATEASGEGHCAGEESNARLQFQDCNTQTCEEVIMGLNETRPYVLCNAKLDVILVVDGSGSLGEDGWEAVVAASKRVAETFGSDDSEVEMAMLLFSGPKSYFGLDVCTGFEAAPPGWDDLTDCSMTWVSHYTDDTEEIEKAIDEMQWPGGTTLTAKALQVAEAEMANGRDDAQTVIVVVTDGVPSDADDVPVISKYLRKNTKLIWVLVGPDVGQYRQQVEKWATKPGEKHVMEVHNVTMLPEPETINAIVADFCPELV